MSIVSITEFMKLILLSINSWRSYISSLCFKLETYDLTYPIYMYEHYVNGQVTHLHKFFELVTFVLFTFFHGLDGPQVE